MKYISDFIPSFLAEDTLDVDNSFVELKDTTKAEPELYSLYNVLDYADYFRDLQVLGLIYHPRDDNDAFLSIFYKIDESTDDEVKELVKDIEPLDFEYDTDINVVAEKIKEYQHRVIFSKKLGYATFVEKDDEIVGYLIKINDSVFFTYANKDYHINSYNDDFHLERDISSKWFRKIKYINKTDEDSE